MMRRSFLIRQKWGESFHHVHKRFNLWAALATAVAATALCSRSIVALRSRVVAALLAASAHFFSPLHIFRMVHQVHEEDSRSKLNSSILLLLLAFDQSLTTTSTFLAKHSHPLRLHHLCKVLSTLTPAVSHRKNRWLSRSLKVIEYFIYCSSERHLSYRVHQLSQTI